MYTEKDIIILFTHLTLIANITFGACTKKKGLNKFISKHYNQVNLQKEIYENVDEYSWKTSWITLINNMRKP